jgi:hypothetical protein
MFPPMAVSPTATWDTSLPGKWTYRSYANRADIIVNDDPEPAVRNLAAMFGQGSTANNATKALSLIFGEGIMTFDPPSGNTVSGTFDMGGGYVLDLKGTMQTSSSGGITVELFDTGRTGTPTADWEYDYRANTTPKWANGSIKFRRWSAPSSGLSRTMAGLLVLLRHLSRLNTELRARQATCLGTLIAWPYDPIARLSCA